MAFPLYRNLRRILCGSSPSFRGDAKHRTTMCHCTSENLEIPGLVLAHHPGMTFVGFRERSLRLRHDPDIGLRRFPALWIDRLGLVVGDRARDDHVLALFPVGGRGD